MKITPVSRTIVLPVNGAQKQREADSETGVANRTSPTLRSNPSLKLIVIVTKLYVNRLGVPKGFRGGHCRRIVESS